MWKDIPHPCGQAGSSLCLVKEHGEQDHGTENLCLMYGWSSGVGVKPGDVNADGIKVQVEELHFFGFIFSEMVFGIPGDLFSGFLNNGSIFAVALPR